MAGYDSDEYAADDLDAPRKRQKRFTFKNFAQRVAEVGLPLLARFHALHLQRHTHSRAH